MARVHYYSSLDEDMVTTNPAAPLPADYAWLPKTRRERWLNRAVTFGARMVGTTAIRWGWHYHLVGLAKLRRYVGGCFLYANHTQPVGDAFMPLVMGGRRKTYVIASAANLGVPVMGKLVPHGGGLVLPERRQLPAFNRVIETVIDAGAMVTVYPEAHVWPYATQIRPFVAGAFHYPVATQAPVFVQTTTYQQGRGRHPRIVVYLDGPITPSGETRTAQRADLAAQVAATMQQRAALSNVTYIDYQRKEEEE